MSDGDSPRSWTQRERVADSELIVGGVSLTGRRGGGEWSGAPTDAARRTDTQAMGVESATDDCTDGGANESTSDVVSMSPLDDGSFDGVPADVVTAFPQYAGVAIAPGRGDAVTGGIEP